MRSLLFFVPLCLGTTWGQIEQAQDIEEVSVTAIKKNKYREDSSFVVGKLPLTDLENPQVYNTVKRELLEEQNIGNFHDALKNATGITRLWESTGRGGDGAEFYSMRGFSVQPTMINGLPSLTNGVIDPANVESIEVLKGPSGTLFGSPAISYGGLINVTTKKPFFRDGGAFSYMVGNFGLNRITIDLNKAFTKKAAVRLNGAFHHQNSFQNAGYRRAFYFAPSFHFKPSEKLTFLVNTEFNLAEGAYAPMIFLNRSQPLSYNSIDFFERNYMNSYTSNDLTMKNQTFSLQAQALYQLGKNWTSQTAVSSSIAGTNGYYHYLWDLSDGESFYRYMSKRNGATQAVDLQQNFIGDFHIGSLRNKLVVGVDYYQSDVSNSSSGWVGNGIVNIKTEEDSGDLTQVGADSLVLGTFEGVTTATNRVMSAYLSDVLYLLPQLSAMVSVRLDNFQSEAASWSSVQNNSQLALSPKFGLVYQPIKKQLSIFANYMNGFTNIAPVQVADINGSNVSMKTFDPEQANQIEGGIKTDLFKNRLALTASYYHITVSNKLMQDPENVNNTIQGAEVVSQGTEFSLIANPVNGLNIVAGYSFNDAEVTHDHPNSGYLGLRPEEAGPSQVFNFWISYEIPKTQLKGLTFGVGGNGASGHYAMNRHLIGSFLLPSYQVYNASLSYQRKNYSIGLRVNNLLNTKYYSGWSTISPQQLRNVSLRFGYRF